MPLHDQIWGPLLGPTVPLHREATLPLLVGGLLSEGQGVGRPICPQVSGFPSPFV